MIEPDRLPGVIARVDRHLENLRTLELIHSHTSYHISFTSSHFDTGQIRITVKQSLDSDPPYTFSWDIKLPGFECSTSFEFDSWYAHGPEVRDGIRNRHVREVSAALRKHPHRITSR